MSAILPGATIGILGGGQLGRMVAMAARSFGYRIHVMDPDPSCPARFVVDACFEGGWDDVQAATDLARGSDVVTLEIEQVSVACLEAAAKYAPVRPSADLLRVIQNRIRQKDWLRERGFPLGPWHAARSEQDLAEAITVLGGRCFVKSATGGYDGRSQVKIGFGDSITPAEAWRLLGQQPCVVEQALDLDREISVMVARSPSGETKSFPSATNHHEKQILVWSVIPSLGVAADRSAGAKAGLCHRRLVHAGRAAGRRDVSDQRRRAAGQRTRAAPAQQLPRQRARLRHQPVRAVRARRLRPAAGRRLHRAAGRHREPAGRSLARSSAPLRPRTRRAGRPRCIFTRSTSPARRARWAISPRSGLLRRKRSNGCWRRSRGCRCCRARQHR